MSIGHSIYRGSRTPRRYPPGEAVVTKDGQPFSPERSLKVWPHSPTGFEWGYGGSGPAQLALAILLEETDQETALRSYQIFKEEWIATLGRQETWEITSEQVQRWLRERAAAGAVLNLTPPPGGMTHAPQEVHRPEARGAGRQTSQGPRIL